MMMSESERQANADIQVGDSDVTLGLHIRYIPVHHFLPRTPFQCSALFLPTSRYKYTFVAINYSRKNGGPKKNV
jgi:hypothetical protein